MTALRAPTIVPALAAACALTLLAGGCGGSEPESPAAPPAALTEGVPTAPGEPAPAPEPSEAASSERVIEPAPTLPPGDPGTESPAAEPPAEEPMPVRTVVPVGAMLNVETIEAIAGSRWTIAPTPPDSCDAARPAAAVGARSVALSASEQGRVVETVSTYRTTTAAERSLNALAGRLRGCGWQPGRDPMVGEAAAALSRRGPGGTERVVVLTAEGVIVTLTGSGTAAGPDAWAALVDVAQGSSCLATRHGCH